MLHLGGADRSDRVRIAQRETDALTDGGVDAVLVEDYFGGADDVEAVLAWLASERPELTVGVNLLRDHRRAFALAARYPVRFIQVDSVAGHLPPDEDARFATELAGLRAETPVYLLGGVRFKYQPVTSGRSLEDDLRIGMSRCDAIVVTGDATGQETGLDKIRQFRDVVGPGCPLFVGAGITPANCREQLALTDGAIVGSWLKDTHRAEGIVERAHVVELMTIVRSVRGESREER
jgi:predicted TIM-barrel enzyme